MLAPASRTKVAPATERSNLRVAVHKFSTMDSEPASATIIVVVVIIVIIVTVVVIVVVVG